MQINRFKTQFAEDISIDYLAGLFDGEGCICLSSTTASGTKKRYPHLIVSLAQSGDEGFQILSQIQAQFGGMLRKSKKYKETHKDPYQLRWTGKKAVRFLNQVSPSLKIKKQKAFDICNHMDDYYAN